MEKKYLTPKEWQELEGIIVIDPDGWRKDGKSFDEPISKDEFNQRMVLSTRTLLRKKNENH